MRHEHLCSIACCLAHLTSKANAQRSYRRTERHAAGVKPPVHQPEGRLIQSLAVATFSCASFCIALSCPSRHSPKGSSSCLLARTLSSKPRCWAACRRASDGSTSESSLHQQAVKGIWTQSCEANPISLRVQVNLCGVAAQRTAHSLSLCGWVLKSCLAQHYTNCKS